MTSRFGIVTDSLGSDLWDIYADKERFVRMGWLNNGLAELADHHNEGGGVDVLMSAGGFD